RLKERKKERDKQRIKKSKVENKDRVRARRRVYVCTPRAVAAKRDAPEGIATQTTCGVIDPARACASGTPAQKTRTQGTARESVTIAAQRVQPQGLTCTVAPRAAARDRCPRHVARACSLCARLCARAAQPHVVERQRVTNSRQLHTPRRASRTRAR